MPAVTGEKKLGNFTQTATRRLAKLAQLLHSRRALVARSDRRRSDEGTASRIGAWGQSTTRRRGLEEIHR
jgi:hypothetical protein